MDSNPEALRSDYSWREIGIARNQQRVGNTLSLSQANHVCDDETVDSFLIASAVS
jgi:hypothetical protein